MALWINDSGATTDEIARGLAAARRVFELAGYTPEECEEQARARAEGDDYGLLRSGTWDAAERAALRACCAGWARIPDAAHLTING